MVNRQTRGIHWNQSSAEAPGPRPPAGKSLIGVMAMLPCRPGCPFYQEGCHKTCAQWQLFQEKQQAQRQAKKQYLQFYNDLCAQVVRQCRAIEYRRMAW